MKYERWVCRQWTETSENGWVSEFDTFDTETEANECGRMFIRLINRDELSREYEVYREVHYVD